LNIYGLYIPSIFFIRVQSYGPSYYIVRSFLFYSKQRG